ncbi:MAG: hypothetical protein RL518_2053 [Pseudomonadota bacterium]
MVRIAYNIIHIPKNGETKRFDKRAIDLCTAAGIENLGVPPVHTPTMAEIQEFHQKNPNFKFKAHEIFGAPFPGNCGVVGAFASHYAVWKQMTDTRHDAVIVLEDESYLTEDFIHTVNCLLLCAPVPWDFVSLFVPTNQNVMYNESRHQIMAPGLCKAYQTSSSAAYVVSQKGALTALYDIAMFGFALPIDLYIWGRGPGKFVNYCLSPYLPPIVQVSNDGSHSHTQVGDPVPASDEELSLLERCERPSSNLVN